MCDTGGIQKVLQTWCKILLQGSDFLCIMMMMNLWIIVGVNVINVLFVVTD